MARGFDFFVACIVSSGFRLQSNWQTCSYGAFILFYYLFKM